MKSQQNRIELVTRPLVMTGPGMPVGPEGPRPPMQQQGPMQPQQQQGLPPGAAPVTAPGNMVPRPPMPPNQPQPQRMQIVQQVGLTMLTIAGGATVRTNILILRPLDVVLSRLCKNFSSGTNADHFDSPFVGKQLMYCEN